MIDLHCHSLFSDGTDAPEALARRADAAGLTALALTDHDTLSGLPGFLATQPLVKTRLIPGLELSCQFMNMELHILGLFIDPWAPRLQQGMPTMIKHVTEGFNAMPPRGICMDCTAEDYQAVIEWMSK